MKMQINEALKILQAPKYVLEKLDRCNQLYTQDHTITEANYSKVTLTRQQLTHNISHDATIEAYNQLEQMRMQTEYKDNLVIVMGWLGEHWQSLFDKLTAFKLNDAACKKAIIQEIAAEADIKDNLIPKYNTPASSSRDAR